MKQLHLAALAVHELPDARKTNKYVDDRFEGHPLTEDHVDNVPVSTAHEPTKTNETPVECTDRDQCAGNCAESTLVTHRKLLEKK